MSTEELKTLDDWLGFIERLHDKPIDLGLGRMKTMIERMGIHFDCPVITVAGTNGKGSTCAMLERIYREAGYRTGMHTSPHLLRFNERAVICGREATDDELIAAFRKVEAARDGLSLSYFEYTGLAVLKLFQDAALDVVILEIGLGGRLDAMNSIDADVSVIAAVGIDHTAFLGPTRELIGIEKAHIYRPGRPAVCSDPEPPVTVPEFAHKIGARYFGLGREFSIDEHADGTFGFRIGDLVWDPLPKPSLAGENQYRNAAGALAAAALLRDRLPLTQDAVSRALADTHITARFECVTKDPCPTILDVGHNPQAAGVLADNLRRSKRPGEWTIAVFGMLVDKDRPSVCRAVKGEIDEWYMSGLPTARGCSGDLLWASMEEAGIDMTRVTRTESVAASLAAARAAAQKRLAEHPEQPVRIIVFGSFVTVTGALEALAAEGIRR